VLLDIDRIAPCMPGATVTKIDGDDFEGTVKVKVGPITVTYGGSASFLEKDESDRRAVIEARGRETRGTGTATARVTAQLHDEGKSTRVVVSTDLAVTGKPAQFGRGVMSDVGGKLLGRFAECLSGQLAAGQPAPAAAGADGAGGDGASSSDGATGTPAAAGGDAAPASVLDAPAARAAGPAEPRQEAEAIDLLDAAGGAVAKRLVPVLGIAALLAILIAVLRRRR
jgi:carbon monoxide dehydrogenase subunit G